MTRLSAWKERWVLVVPVALFVLGNVGFFATDRTIERSRQRSLERARDELARRLEAAEAGRDQARRSRERLTEIKRALEVFYTRKIGPRRQTLAPVVEEVHQLTKKAGLLPRQIGYSLEPLTKMGLTRMTITFSVTGDYAAVRRLIRAFETNSRWLGLKSLGLAENADASGSTRINLVAVTYFTEPEGRLPKAVAAAASRNAS